MDQRLKMLKDSLEVLAADANQQLEYLRSLDTERKTDELGSEYLVDELALEYNDTAILADQMLEEGIINNAQRDCVKALDGLLDRMSGQQNAHLWTAGALRSREEWSQVRASAGECLKLFQ
ncbi:MAG: hypothetical protein L0Z53_20200 [Acidobacteriales bacterium]|nr:hypothetical protein [Terriglobales bacterium]